MEEIFAVHEQVPTRTAYYNTQNNTQNAETIVGNWLHQSSTVLHAAHTVSPIQFS